MHRERPPRRSLRLGVYSLVFLVTFCSPLFPQPTLTPDEQARFLATARIVSSRNLPRGITRPVRVTLTDGTLTHDAAFSTVDERKPVMQFSTGRTELDFVDSYRYSIAAYRIARLVGLDDMVPVTIERQWRGRVGALAWWIDAKWDEAARRKQKVKPPDSIAWSRQVARMRVFEQLLADTDRNLGNILITEDWKLWMIDFTRAFRRTHQIEMKRPLTQCDRQLLERLRTLTRQDLLDAARPYVGGAEVDPLLIRRDKIVARFEELIARRGEAAVLFDQAPQTAQQSLSHTYVLGDPAAARDPRQFAKQLLEKLHDTLLEATVLPATYPKPCRIHVDRKNADGTIAWRCLPASDAWTESNVAAGAQLEAFLPFSLLLDEEGHFPVLSIVAYPSAQYFPVQIYLVPHVPDSRLTLKCGSEDVRPECQEHWLIPRVTLSGFWQSVTAGTLEAFQRAMDRGIRATGAVPLEP